MRGVEAAWEDIEAEMERLRGLLEKNEGRVKEIVDEKLLRERDEARAEADRLRDARVAEYQILRNAVNNYEWEHLFAYPEQMENPKDIKAGFEAMRRHVKKTLDRLDDSPVEAVRVTVTESMDETAFNVCGEAACKLKAEPGDTLLLVKP